VHHDDFGQVRTVADELGIVLFLKGYADEAFRLVGVKLGIVAHDLCCGDGLESGKFCLSRILLAVFFL
jgi:hypothetical protein